MHWVRPPDTLKWTGAGMNLVCFNLEQEMKVKSSLVNMYVMNAFYIVISPGGLLMCCCPAFTNLQGTWCYWSHPQYVCTIMESDFEIT